jgi:hypothetical protein
MASAPAQNDSLNEDGGHTDFIAFVSATTRSLSTLASRQLNNTLRNNLTVLNLALDTDIVTMIGQCLKKQLVIPSLRSSPAHSTRA